MPKRIVIDPMTRIEGHLRFETTVEDGVVVDSRCGGEMFRGIEKALIGYDARVAQQVTQRICGACPYAHAEAASLALEAAMGMTPTENGHLLRNLIVGAYQLYDYLFHFYILSALDFIDITAISGYRGRDSEMLALRDWVASETRSNKIFPAAPFLPRYQGVYASDQGLNLSAIKSYLDVMPILADLHKMIAIFGGKAPHPVAIEAGGVTTVPTLEKLALYKTWLDKAASFIRQNYFHDVMGVAQAFPSYFKEGKGWGNLLSFPYFPDKHGKNHAFAGGSTHQGRFEILDLARITEDHSRAYYKNEPAKNVKPLQSQILQPLDWNEFEQERKRKNGKYSWCKAPRYGGKVMEVGPAARIVNTYLSGGNLTLNHSMDRLNLKLGIGLADYNSVMGRHLARYVAAAHIVELLEKQLNQIEPEAPAFIEKALPKNAVGHGLTEATRGALAHWIETDERGHIRNYEIITPTTWNMSPRDATGQPGAVEKMLIGTRVADLEHPLELARIVRSTDPCMACSVH